MTNIILASTSTHSLHFITTENIIEVDQYHIEFCLCHEQHSPLKRTGVDLRANYVVHGHVTEMHV